MKFILAIIYCLPELIRMFRAIDNKIAFNAQESTIKKDLKAITNAFEAQDEKKLKDIFTNNSSVDAEFMSFVRENDSK